MGRVGLKSGHLDGLGFGLRHQNVPSLGLVPLSDLGRHLTPAGKVPSKHEVLFQIYAFVFCLVNKAVDVFQMVY